MIGSAPKLQDSYFGFEAARFRSAPQLKHAMTHKPVSQILVARKVAEGVLATAHRYGVGLGSPRFPYHWGREHGPMKLFFAKRELMPEVSQETPSVSC